jgi:hypothetical protein
MWKGERGTLGMEWKGKEGGGPSCFSFASASLAYALGYFTPAALRYLPVFMIWTKLRMKVEVAAKMT